MKTNEMRNARLLASSATILMIACVVSCKKEVAPKPAEHAGHDHAAESGEQGGHEGHDHGADAAAKTGNDEGHEDEKEVRLSVEELKRAGVTTARVGPGTVLRTLRRPARVAVDENAVVHVNPRIGGIVKEIHRKLGERVLPGDDIVELLSPDLGRLVSDTLKSRFEVEAAMASVEGESKLFEERASTLDRLSDGAIAVAQQIYDREKELFEKGISLVRPLLDAERELKTAVFEKERARLQLKGERATRLLALATALKQAEIDLVGNRGRLTAVGLSDAEVAELLSKPDGALGRYCLRAPRGGVVAERHITPGEYVGTETTLAVIQDMSKLWILVSVNEKDIAAVTKGQRALVRIDALPKASIQGNVTFIELRIDEATRSADVRIEVANDRIEGWSEEFPLRPGMFGTVELVTAERNAALVVPEDALVNSDGVVGVFVKDADGGFVFRNVTVGLTGAGTSEIADGLSAGDEIAVTGTFTLKSMLNKASMAHDHDH